MLFRSPSAPESAQKYLPSDTENFAEGLWFVVKSAIKEFQRRTGLYPDGCTGQLTYNKLKQYGFNK